MAKQIPQINARNAYLWETVYVTANRNEYNAMDYSQTTAWVDKERGLGMSDNEIRELIKMMTPHRPTQKKLATAMSQNGTYSSQLNGYYHYISNATKGESLFGFVGLKEGGSMISTFHIKTATQLGLK